MIEVIFKVILGSHLLADAVQVAQQVAEKYADVLVLEMTLLVPNSLDITVTLFPLMPFSFCYGCDLFTHLEEMYYLYIWSDGFGKVCYNSLQPASGQTRIKNKVE